MENNDVWQMIGIDPLFIAYSNLAIEYNLQEPSSKAHTGKVLAKFGRYTMLSHCFIDSLMFALNESPKTCWQLVFYLSRNIVGIGRNKKGDPKIYIEYKPTCLIKKANITGIGSFYKAIKILKEKNIIFFREKYLYLNIFPLTWNIENEEYRNEIKKIVDKELNRMERNNNENE